MLPCPARRASTALHFYQNRQLELYASKEANRLTLRQLVIPVSFPLLRSFMHLTGILRPLHGSRPAREGCRAFWPKINMS